VSLTSGSPGKAFGHKSRKQNLFLQIKVIALPRKALKHYETFLLAVGVACLTHNQHSSTLFSTTSFASYSNTTHTKACLA